MCKRIVNMKKTTDRQTVRFMDIRMYSVRKGDPLVTIHYNMKEVAVHMHLFQTGRRSMEMDLQMNPMVAYTEKLGPDTKKIEDLKKMCNDGIIPKAYHPFYNDLASSPETAVHDGSESEYESE